MNAIVPELPKARTGIDGLDDVTFGGLPAGRPTLICGAAGCGKTLLATEFLVRGATRYDEPGVFVAFEETAHELAQNVASLGFALDALVQEKKLIIDHVYIERSEIEQTGDYDLEGLFVRLGHAIDTIGAKRVVLDTLEALFGGLGDSAILRAELRRLFRWLKDKGVTAIITAERGDGALTRHGLEEYVSDCVILLDHRIDNQLSTRRMRIIKYRGSAHGTNEFPFLIGDGGISVLPLTSVGKLEHKASSEHISTGIARLDAMLGGKGYYRGSTILISGAAGTGKSTLATRFAAACCERRERCIYFAFEESMSEIIRNMKSTGLDLNPCIEAGYLRFNNSRPTLFGLESHLASMHKAIDEWQPRAVIIDPISNFLTAGNDSDVKSLLIRLFDFLKSKQITAVMTSLTSASDAMESSSTDVSSLIDTWLLVRDMEHQGERNRGLYVLKARGLAHSNQIREFRITAEGIQLTDVFLGPEGVLTGSARLAREEKVKADLQRRKKALELNEKKLEIKRRIFEARMATLRNEFEGDSQDFAYLVETERLLLDQEANNEAAMALSRGADAPVNKANDQ